MHKDNLHTLFDTLKNNFDVATPEQGHHQRFLEKLHHQNQTNIAIKPKLAIWKITIGIAASLALLVALLISYSSNTMSRDLASVSTEMAITQNFFTRTINDEIQKLSNETSPEYQKLKIDAFFQLDILQQNYLKLRDDLNESGNDKRVIHAMISNYQSRIILLQNVLEQIDELKQLEYKQQDENQTTL
ncbi:MAG: hypothetical protein HRT67_11995 [Flavobacteriaceae bacterium]|nr:hypothetical protein [Flavobacteriaceae bacterium]